MDKKYKNVELGGISMKPVCGHGLRSWVRAISNATGEKWGIVTYIRSLVSWHIRQCKGNPKLATLPKLKRPKDTK